MRQLSLLAVLFLGPISMSGQPLPEWYRVHTFDDSIIEMNTVLVTRITSDVTRVRFRWTFNQPQSFRETPTIKYFSELEVIEINCKQKSYRPYHVTYFDRAGQTIQIHDSPGRWSRVVDSMTDKLLVPACELIKSKGRQPEADETDRVLTVAHDFFQQLERSKDFKPLINRFFAPYYLEGYRQDTNRNWFQNLDRELARKVSADELERFYVASMNAGYVTWVYLLPKLVPDSDETSHDLKLIPADVLSMIKRHPYSTGFGNAKDFDFLADKIDTVERLKLYTDLLETFAALMRSHIKKEDMVRVKASPDWREYAQSFLSHERVCRGNCLNLPNGTKVFDVEAPIISLQIAELNGSLKVISARLSF